MIIMTNNMVNDNNHMQHLMIHFILLSWKCNFILYKCYQHGHESVPFKKNHFAIVRSVAGKITPFWSLLNQKVLIMSLECECRNPPHNRVGGILPVYEVSGKSSACVTEAIRYGINTLSRDQSHFWVPFYVSTESLYSNNDQKC